MASAPRSHATGKLPFLKPDNLPAELMPSALKRNGNRLGNSLGRPHDGAEVTVNVEPRTEDRIGSETETIGQMAKESCLIRRSI